MGFFSDCFDAFCDTVAPERDDPNTDATDHGDYSEDSNADSPDTDAGS